jgi:hypothetical protein
MQAQPVRIILALTLRLAKTSFEQICKAILLLQTLYFQHLEASCWATSLLSALQQDLLLEILAVPNNFDEKQKTNSLIQLVGALRLELRSLLDRKNFTASLCSHDLMPMGLAQHAVRGFVYIAEIDRVCHQSSIRATSDRFALSNNHRWAGFLKRTFWRGTLQRATVI